MLTRLSHAGGRALKRTYHPISRNFRHFGADTPKVPTEIEPSTTNAGAVISALNDAQSVLGYSLQAPKYVLVGDQSSGKTSLVEALVGAELSVKDATMATRRPLMITTMRGRPGIPMYAEFAEDGERTTDFTKVQARVAAENAVVGEVSPEPILLTVVGEHLTPMQIIDLPGFIITPTPDQPEDLAEQISAVNKPYMNDPLSLLCVVTTGRTLFNYYLIINTYIYTNKLFCFELFSLFSLFFLGTTDPATSLALREARRSDPTGARSTGIITKVDLVGDNKDSLVNLLLGINGTHCAGGKITFIYSLSFSLTTNNFFYFFILSLFFFLLRRSLRSFWCSM